ncbi:MAG: antibiotic biosynthesis monooxygenase [Pseudomonadota bacterium]|nr:antibiotic biosynthesis monooxygenase [Pseudomonadota bacterium]
MYIAFNRFRIIPDRHADFEKLWLNYQTHREKVPGFLFFDLIKGKTEKGCAIYASHTTWRNQQDFLTWTKSESFRRAHKNAGDYSKLYLGHPEFEGFEVAL